MSRTKREGFIFCVKFKNSNIFGKGIFRDEVFPRYRQLMIGLQKYLRSREDLKEVAKKEYVFDMLPVLDKDAYEGECIKLNEDTRRNTSNLEIVSIPDFMRETMVLCKEMSEVSCVIKRCNDNHYYGIDEILYFVISKIIEIKPDSQCVMDIGAASGNVARLYLSRGKIDKLILVDSNTQVCEQLHALLTNKTKESGTILEISNDDCLNCNIPKKLDILSITVDTDSVISFLEKRCNEIKSSLGNDGIFILELLNCIGEKGYSFVNMLVANNTEYFINWPWYNEKMSAYKIFAHSKAVMINNEVILVASNNLDYVEKIMNIIEFEHSQPYSKFISNELNKYIQYELNSNV